MLYKSDSPRILLTALLTTVLLAMMTAETRSDDPISPNLARTIPRDFDADGHIDCWQRFNEQGRKVEIRFADPNSNQSQPVLLDSLPTSDVLHLIIALDGVPFDVINQLYREGRFRLFHPPTRVITCFPGMTDPAFRQIFGGEKPTAYQSRYFDRPSNRFVGGNRAHVTARAAGWTKTLDYRCSPMLDALAYIDPKKVFRHEISGIRAMFDRSTTGTAIAYSVATAGLATTGGRKATLEYLQVIDDLCEQLVYDRRGKVKITLLADHGHSPSPRGRVSLTDLLARTKYNLKNRLKDANDVAVVEYGLLTYAACHTRDPEGLSIALVKDPRADIVCYRPTAGGLDVRVCVRSQSGFAVIRRLRDRDRYSYQPQTGDPLQLRPILERLRKQGNVDSEGFIDDRTLFAATIEHIYPDPLRRLWMAFDGLVKKPADLIVCLEQGFYHGSDMFDTALGDIAGTHGSLNRTDSTTFTMTMLGELPRPLRLEDVIPAIEKLYRE